MVPDDKSRPILASTRLRINRSRDNEDNVFGCVVVSKEFFADDRDQETKMLAVLNRLVAVADDTQNLIRVRPDGNMPAEMNLPGSG